MTHPPHTTIDAVVVYHGKAKIPVTKVPKMVTIGYILVTIWGEMGEKKAAEVPACISHIKRHSSVEPMIK
jgi:hypothetical protein